MFRQFARAFLVAALLFTQFGCAPAGSGSSSSDGDLTALAAPVLSPPGGDIAGDQYISITSAVPGALIRYTVDGSLPTPTNGAIYNAPFGLKYSSRVKAVAFLDNRESPVGGADYYIPRHLSNNGFSTTPDSYTIYFGIPRSFRLYGHSLYGNPEFAVTAQPLHGTLSGTPPYLIYTADAGYLGEDSLTYTVSDYGLTSAPETVRFTMVAASGPAAPLITASPDTNTNLRIIKITPAFDSETILFTLDGSTPTWSNYKYYNAPFPVLGETVIKAVTYDDGVISPVSSLTVSVNQVATPDVDVQILTPNSSSPVEDSLFVAAKVTASEPVDAVWATVGGHSVNLAYTTNVYCRQMPDSQEVCYDGFGGTLDFAGVHPGTDRLTVTARDHLGREASRTIYINTLIYDELPTLTVLSPVEDDAAHPTLRFQATCKDDKGPGKCLISVEVSGSPNVIVVPPTSGAIDAVVDLSQYSGKDAYVYISAIDSSAQSTYSSYTIPVEAGQNFESVATVGGEVLDFDGGRVLSVLDWFGKLSITTVPGGQITDLQSTGYFDQYYSDAFLTPKGAIATMADYPWKLTSWEGGQVVDLSPVEQYIPLRVAGKYALWCYYHNIYRRDLITGETILITANAANSLHDVAENGAVAWTRDYHTLNLFDGKKSKPLAADYYDNYYPRTDGQLTAYIKKTGGLYALALHDGQAETLLNAFSQNDLYPDNSYQIAGGVVYYIKPGLLGQQAVWRRNADGTQTELANFSTITDTYTYANLDRAGADGTAMITYGEDRYLIGVDGNLTRVSGSHGKTKQIGGQWYLMLGNWVGRYK